MSFRERVYERARRARKHIVLPEGDDPRVRAAAARLEADGFGVVEVLGRPLPPSPVPGLIRHLRARRPDKFPTDAAARAALEHPLTFGACLVGAGLADVMVGGATFPSGDTIRAALWTVGTAPGIATVSGAFYMVRDETVLTFTDCAVVPEPTPAQLADAGAAAARDRRRIVGDEPVVAFLSYSTRGSATGERVERVRQAVSILQARGPGFVCDGELQGDAALVADVAARKAPGSPVAGRANVLVFPDLDSGNIAYKLVQRLGGWEAIGPILQGLARPVADLSRGATADDIVDTAVVAVLQAGERT
ncbi:MAG: phosphate acetyltransferase [Gemmatimonadetes bacterium]|nr:MAG: phosphate acetyltransferase [Gemmatimonadota bacterium]PYP25123.1 MAG: phosphate acetyltransferase [Gemmatimonadota bacterium]